MAATFHREQTPELFKAIFRHRITGNKLNFFLRTVLLNCDFAPRREKIALVTAGKVQQEKRNDSSRTHPRLLAFFPDFSLTILESPELSRFPEKVAAALLVVDRQATRHCTTRLTFYRHRCRCHFGRVNCSVIQVN